MRMHMGSEMRLIANLHLPLQPALEALLPKEVVDMVRQGRLGEADTSAEEATQGLRWDARPDGTPLSSDELWLSSLIGSAWPYIRGMIQQTAWQMLPDVLGAAAPSWLADLNLTKLVAGDVPPRIYDIHIYHDEHDVVEDLFIDFSFDWKSNFDFELAIKMLPGNIPVIPDFVEEPIKKLLSIEAGVEDIHVNGRARAALRPLMREFPVVGAIHVGLWEMPDLNFKMTGWGGTMSALPMLHSWLLDTVRSMVFGPYMLPSGYTYKVQPDVFVPVPLDGVLEVEVVEARRVPKMDLLTQSDPYVVLFVEYAKKRRTRVIQNDKNPTWNETYLFPIGLEKTQALHLELYDWDQFGGSDKIGDAMVHIRDIEPNEERDMWVEIRDSAREEVNAQEGADSRKGGKPAKGVGSKIASALAAPFKKGNPKHCKVHLKVKYAQFTEEEVKVVVDAQKHGPIQVLGRGDTIDRVSTALVEALLCGHMVVSLQTAHGLEGLQGGGLLSSATVVAEVSVGEERKRGASHSPTERGGSVVELNEEISMQVKAEHVLQGEDARITVALRDADGGLVGDVRIPLLKLIRPDESGGVTEIENVFLLERGYCGRPDMRAVEEAGGQQELPAPQLAMKLRWEAMLA